MKLKDFLKQFDGHDPEGEVIIQMAVGCCGETEDIDFDNKTVWEEDVLDKGNHPTGAKYTRILFSPFEFLSSCRKYGRALGK